MARISAGLPVSTGSKVWTRPGTAIRQCSMRTELALTISVLCGAGLVGACGKGEPPARQAADTAAAPAAGGGPALLSYVTNEDSQELSIIDTRTDSVVA